MMAPLMACRPLPGVGKIGDGEHPAERSQAPGALQKAEALRADSEYVTREHRHQN